MKQGSIAGHLYLVGFMGSGKSAMGRLLAQRLRRPFRDMDELIEKRQGQSIAEVFEGRGQSFFRSLERRLLEEISTEPPAVIATGGGLFESPANRQLMHDSGLVVWLDVPFELACERALRDPERPLAAGLERFERLYALRRDTYALADVTVEVGDDPKLVTCSKILEKLRQSGF